MMSPVQECEVTSFLIYSSHAARHFWDILLYECKWKEMNSFGYSIFNVKEYLMLTDML